MEWKSRLIRLAVPVTCAAAIAVQLPGYHDSTAQAVVLDEYAVQSAAQRQDNNDSDVADGLKAVDTALIAGGGLYVLLKATRPVSDVAMTTVPLSHFSTLAEQTGLNGTLQRAGDNTAFIPTNDAIAQMDPTLLKPENKDRLATVLRGHILVGRYTLAELKNAAREAGAAGRKFRTLAGTDATVTVKGDALQVNGVEIKGSSDINASNGVVHPVDTVLP